MGLVQDFDRLEHLIVERENHGVMKGLLLTIRDQVEQAEEENAAITIHASALEIKLAQSNAKLLQSNSRHLEEMTAAKAEYAALAAEHAKPKRQQPTPMIEVVNDTTMEPPEPVI